MWPMRRDPDIVREAEHLLHGLAINDHPGLAPAPAWRAVNFLAHSDSKQLRRAGDRLEPTVWTTTLGAQARAVLAKTDDDADLVRLQRDALVPLELRLLHDADATPRTPAQLSNLIATTLANR